MQSTSQAGLQNWTTVSRNPHLSVCELARRFVASRSKATVYAPLSALRLTPSLLAAVTLTPTTPPPVLRIGASGFSHFLHFLSAVLLRFLS